MRAIIKWKQATGIVPVPASKSIMQRVCAAALLHKGQTVITNYGISEDEKAALDIILRLGASVRQAKDHLEIDSKGVIMKSSHIDCGESGLSARLFTPIAALCDKKIIIDGRGSLRKRDMSIFGDMLPMLGIILYDFDGHIPFAIQGPLIPADIMIDGSASSQFLSGLLFALSAIAVKKIMVTVNDLRSQPYVDLTLDILKRFGKPVANKDYKYFEIDPQQFSTQRQVSVQIESDWSSAAGVDSGGSYKGHHNIKRPGAGQLTGR